MQPAGRAVNKPLVLQSTTPISPNTSISVSRVVSTPSTTVTHKMYRVGAFFPCTIILTLTTETILKHVSSPFLWNSRLLFFFPSTCSPQSPSRYQLAPPHTCCEYNKSITVPNLTLQNKIYLPRKSEAGGDLENVCQNNAKYWYSGTCNTSVKTVGLVCVKFSVYIYYVWVLTPVRTTCECGRIHI